MGCGVRGPLRSCSREAYEGLRRHLVTSPRQEYCGVAGRSIQPPRQSGGSGSRGSSRKTLCCTCVAPTPPPSGLLPLCAGPDHGRLSLLPCDHAGLAPGMTQSRGASKGGPLRRAFRLSGPASLPLRGGGRASSQSCVGPCLAPSAAMPLGACLGYPASLCLRLGPAPCPFGSPFLPCSLPRPGPPPTLLSLQATVSSRFRPPASPSLDRPVRCVPPGRQGSRSQWSGCSALRSLLCLYDSPRAGPLPLWPCCEDLCSPGSRLAGPQSPGQRPSTLHSVCIRWRGEAFLPHGRAGVLLLRAAVLPSQSARSPFHSPMSRQPTVPLHVLSGQSLDAPSVHHARWATGSVGQHQTDARGHKEKMRLLGFETPTFGFQVCVCKPLSYACCIFTLFLFCTFRG